MSKHSFHFFFCTILSCSFCFPVLAQNAFMNSYADTISLQSGFGRIISTSTNEYVLFEGSGPGNARLLRTDVNGNLISSISIGDSAYSSQYFDCIKTPDGNYVLCGRKGPGFSPLVCKIDINGNTIWSHELPINATANKALLLSDSTILLLGGQLIHLDTAGIPIATYFPFTNLPYSYFTHFIQASDGEIVLTGSVDTMPNNNSDFAIIKFALSGTVSFAKAFNGSVWDRVNSCIELPFEGFLLTGETFTTGAGWMDAFQMRLDNMGNLLWFKTYGDAGYNVGTKSIRLPSGELVIVGRTYNTMSPGDPDALLIRTDSNGIPLSAVQYGIPSNMTFTYDQMVRDIAITPDNFYLLSGWERRCCPITDRGFLYKMNDTSCHYRIPNFASTNPVLSTWNFSPTINPGLSPALPFSLWITNSTLFKSDSCFVLGIESATEIDSLVVYPNPTTGSLIVHGQGKFSIIDLLGRVLYTKDIILAVNEVDLSFMNPGTYIYILEEESGMRKGGKVVIK